VKRSFFYGFEEVSVKGNHIRMRETRKLSQLAHLLHDLEEQDKDRFQEMFDRSGFFFTFEML